MRSSAAAAANSHTDDAPAAAAASAAAPEHKSPPGSPSWFSMHHVHRVEREALPEFFLESESEEDVLAAVASAPSIGGRWHAAAGASPHLPPSLPLRRPSEASFNPFRTAQQYKDLRDWMLVAYSSDPAVYLHVTTCLRFLAADFGSIFRVHSFLEQQQLINVREMMAPGSRPHSGCSSSSTDQSNGGASDVSGAATAMPAPLPNIAAAVEG